MTEIMPADLNVEVNGLNIHYLDWGGPSERNLLLVHGQGGTRTTGITSLARCMGSSGWSR